MVVSAVKSGLINACMLEFATLIKEAICVADLVIVNTLTKGLIKDQISVWYNSTFESRGESAKVAD